MTVDGKTPRAGIYGRQSHGSTKSIDEQISECTRDVEDLGWPVADTYRDTVSASRYARKQRDDWPRLLGDVDAGRLDVVVMWESSRGDRTLESWAGFLELCREHGVLIRVTDDDETYDVRKPKHWKQLASDGVSNQYSSDETRQRNLRTARLQAKAGKPNGPTPFGYERVYDPVSRVLVEQREIGAEADIVREIFRRISDGEAVLPLANELRDREAPSPGKWRKSARGWLPLVVRQIVRNKAYIGQRSHDPKEPTGEASEPASAVWPPIVDEGVFWAANRVLDDRSKRYWRSSRAEHVLTGVPACEACGKVFGGSMDARSGLIYLCRGCGSRIGDGSWLEDHVLAYVLGRLARPDVYTTLRRAGADADAESASARAEADGLRAQLDEWRNSALRGETTPATMAHIEDGLNAKIEAAERRAERAGIPPAVRELADAGDELPERWAAMPLAARRDVVAALVDVRIAPGRGRGVKVPPDERVTVTWKGTAE